MRPIPTLYQRNRKTGLVINDLWSPDLSWVLEGEGIATVKVDGLCCRIDDGGLLWKRHDRKPAPEFKRARKRDDAFRFLTEHAKDAPETLDGGKWKPCQEAPDPFTGHWPGFLPVDFQAPENQWHLEALHDGPFDPGTYELIGPKVQGNPYGCDGHHLVMHGSVKAQFYPSPECNFFSQIRFYLEHAHEEGIVWWYGGHPITKIKASDFGIDWKS